MIKKIIRTKDLMRMEEVSLRTAYRRMALIRKKYNFRPKFITVEHYAAYNNLKPSHVQKMLE